MQYLIVMTIGYVLGCSNMALYLARWKKVNIRSHGSGNPGASNAAIVMGWRAGILTGLHDILKAWLAVLLARLLFPELSYGAMAAGAACVMGHIFPVFMKFRGGKGFAPYLGMALALHWKLALIVMALVVLVTVITDYIVLGTTLTILTVPAYLGFAQHSLWPVLILGLVSAVIAYKHRHNYVRIAKGTEIGLRATTNGEHKQI